MGTSSKGKIGGRKNGKKKKRGGKEALLMGLGVRKLVSNLSFILSQPYVSLTPRTITHCVKGEQQ